MTQREIKFRAWDLANNRMVEEPYKFYQLPQGHIFVKEYGATYMYYETWEDIDDGIDRPCHIMQYTGLKDKHGVEIYEGDIVKCHDHPTGYDDCMGDVYFSQGSFHVRGSIIPLSDYGTAWIEVIGNIHQNPELL